MILVDELMWVSNATLLSLLVRSRPVEYPFLLCPPAFLAASVPVFFLQLRNWSELFLKSDKACPLVVAVQTAFLLFVQKGNLKASDREMYVTRFYIQDFCGPHEMLPVQEVKDDGNDSVNPVHNSNQGGRGERVLVKCSENNLGPKIIKSFNPGSS